MLDRASLRPTTAEIRWEAAQRVRRRLRTLAGLACRAALTDSWL